jgi:hypothetical protein
LSQAQAIALGRDWGWAMSSLGNGVAALSRDGETISLPPSHPQYTADRSREVFEQIVGHVPPVGPSLGPPTSGGFDALMRQYRSCGFPVVGVGNRVGPLMPQIRAVSVAAPAPAAIDADHRDWLLRRRYWAQPGYPERLTAENASQRAVLKERWSAKTKRGGASKKWRPAANLAACMSASAMRHVTGWSDEQIAEVMEVESRPGTIGRLVRRGDGYWSAFGAWPWAAFDDGSPPAMWWCDAAAREALIEACTGYDADLQRRAQRSEGMLHALHPYTGST